jgi:TIR domain/Bacterial SH3 domain
MTGKIFINYRRGDDPGYTGRLFDRLQDAFAPEQLFLDVDNIAPGLDFVRVLDERVAECDVVLAVIGKGWLDARDAKGARRLEDPDDFVRIEIAAALSQDKRVIPVLVGDAPMPRPDELPEALRPLARRNAVRLTHERFRADMQGLIKALQLALGEIHGHGATPAATKVKPAVPRRNPFRPAAVVLGALAVLLIAGGAWFWRSSAPSSAPGVKAVAMETPAPAASAPSAAAPMAAAPLANVPAATAATPAVNPVYPAVAMKSVKREVSLGYLNLRAGPGQDQKILARIPAGATGVAVTGSCAPPKDGGSSFPFCPVEWNGLRGWVSSNGLE